MYKERLGQFFEVNAISEEKIPLLIICIGEPAYKLLSDLYDPVKKERKLAFRDRPKINVKPSNKLNL